MTRHAGQNIYQRKPTTEGAYLREPGDLSAREIEQRLDAELTRIRRRRQEVDAWARTGDGPHRIAGKLHHTGGGRL